jgi:chemotaxis protein CheC
MTEEKEFYTKEQIDELKEITNIGAGNAATALSHMLGKKVQMSVPESYVGDLAEVQHIVGESEEKVMAVFFKMHGDAEGAMLMIFPPKDALNFINVLTKNNKKDINDFTEEDKSSISELGNILLGASVAALGKFLNLNILHTIPDQAYDMVGAIMDNVLSNLSQTEEKVLLFKINLKLVEDNGVGGDLYYLFDPESTKKIFSVLNSKIK